MKMLRAFSQKALLLTLLITATFVSCKDDNNEPEPGVDNDPIVGTWQVTGIAPETAGTTIPALDLIPTFASCFTQLKLTFHANNTVTTADCQAAVTAVSPFVPINEGATWKVNGDKLTLSSGSTSQEFKYTRTDTDLKVIVNTNTNASQPPVNAVLSFKRI